MLESGNRTPGVRLMRRIMDVFGPDSAAGSPPPRNEIREIVTRGSATIPYYRHIIHAGSGAHVLEDETEQFDIQEHYEGTAAYEVSGDSMIGADIQEGDRLIVRLGHKIRPNSIILCRYNGELMVKGAAIIGESIWLIPVNDKYKPWECRETDQLEVIGTVIEVIRQPDTGRLREIIKGLK
jgi:DNA polymerase V